MNWKLFALLFVGASLFSEGLGFVKRQATTAAEEDPYGDDDTADIKRYARICKSGRPSADDITKWKKFKSYFPDGYCDGDAAETGCPENPDDLDLSVLTENLQCLRDACPEDWDAVSANDTKLNETGTAIMKCVRELRSQFRNAMRFNPGEDDVRAQMKKTCDCGYNKPEKVKDEAGGYHRCEAKAVHSCKLDDSTPCMNGPGQLYKKGGCRANGGNSSANANGPPTATYPGQNPSATPESKTRELMEFHRVNKLCDPDVATMLRDEKVVYARCNEDLDRQTKLITPCAGDCGLTMRENKFFRHNGVKTKYTDKDDYEWEGTCGYFIGEDGEEYYPRSVYFQGNKNVWHQVLDLCQDFKNASAGNGDVPEQLKFTHIPRIVNPLHKVRKAFNECCTKSLEEYAATERKDESVMGKAESECMANKDVVFDFGFVPSLTRGAISRYHNKKLCTGVYSNSVTNCTDLPEEKKFMGAPDWLKCDQSQDAAAEQMDLKAGRMKPDEIFWFLRYIQNNTVKAHALRACAAGMRVGRTVTVLPGLALGLESQYYALKQVPPPYKSAAMLAFHKCAVFASVHANRYFDPSDARCNDFSLAPESESCPADWTPY